MPRSSTSTAAAKSRTARSKKPHCQGEADTYAAASADDALAAYGFSSDEAPDASWRVQRVSLTEGISRVYECEVAIACADPAVDVDALLGSSCELSISGNKVQIKAKSDLVIKGSKILEN